MPRADSRDPIWIRDTNCLQINKKKVTQAGNKQRQWIRNSQQTKAYWWIWASGSEVNEPTASYTKWSSKEKNKYHVLTHIYGA